MIYDITNALDSILSMLFNIMSNSFTTLQNIQFHGFSLLHFLVAIVMVNAIFTIMIVSAGAGMRVRSGKEKKRKVKPNSMTDIELA